MGEDIVCALPKGKEALWLSRPSEPKLENMHSGVHSHFLLL
nr:MAG TPA: cysteine protease [Caudoviricetes sp.]